MKNDTSFYGKQAVVFRTTMGCLRMKNLGSFFQEGRRVLFLFARRSNVGLHVRTNVRGVEALR